MKLRLTLILTFFITYCFAQKPEQTFLKQLKAKVIDKTYPKIDAILIQRGDSLIMEEYFNEFKKDTPHDVRSSFKSITSLLAGIAIDKKLLSLDDTLGHFYPDLKHEGKRRITVRNLLEMRSGLNCEEFYDIGPECETEMFKTDDWVAFCLGVNLIRQPGLNWSYNSNEPMIVGDIIARASGMTVMDFAKQYLFEPLGISNYKWTVSPKGQGMTAGSFYMLPGDMLKIMNVVKNKGKHGDHQIVNASWIQKSTDAHIIIDMSFVRYARLPNAEYSSARYGFFWYKERLKYKGTDTEIIFSSGNGGQYMMWVPEYDLTMVFTGSNYGNWRGKLPFEMVLEYLAAAG